MLWAKMRFQRIETLQYAIARKKKEENVEDEEERKRWADEKRTTTKTKNGTAEEKNSLNLAKG